jgi:hypothetical protein
MYILDWQNKVFAADLQTRTITLVVDISKFRKHLDSSEEAVAMAFDGDDDSIKIFWMRRKKSPGLWYLVIRNGQISGPPTNLGEIAGPGHQGDGTVA